MTEPVLAVIPARLASERLPRKPLQPLAGRPLVEWVWRRVSGMNLFDRVVIATDHELVVDAGRRCGAEVVLTDPTHPSGTDRVAEVVRSPGLGSYDLIVNVQGDEPLMDRAHLEAAVELLRTGRWRLSTCATPVRDPDEFQSSSVVKVVQGRDGRALYFSRAAIPHRRDGAPTRSELDAAPYLRHLGTYAYRRAALLEWVSLPSSPLERIERLEQLRPLEAGLEMGVAVVGAAARGVDTPEDLARMEGILSGNSGLTPSEPGAHD